jgi:chemotaxis protein MotC
VTANVELRLRQLLLRFPRGLHLEEAIETVAELASRSASSRQSEVSEVLEAALPHLAKDLQLAVSISFARQAARRGQVSMADNWAPRARVLASDGSVQHLKAELYQAAADVIANDEGAATRVLAAIDQQQLTNDDAILLQAAIVVDRRIREPVNAPPPLDGPARREPYEPGIALDPDVASLKKRATANLNRVDRLLEINP